MKRFVIGALAVLVLAVILIVSIAAADKKVVLCHKGQTLVVGEPAAAAHYAHGDTPGSCPGSPKK